MTFATEKLVSGREPVWVVELDLDICDRVYGSVEVQAIDITAFDENQIIHPEALDENVEWSKSFCTISADATTDPDGGSDADKVVEDGNNNEHRVRQGPLSTDGASQYYLSGYGKKDERYKIRLQMNSQGFVNEPYANFNLTTGVVIASADVDASGIVDVGDGWYRCWISATSDAVSAAQAVEAWLLDAAGAGTYQGDGSSGAFVWGIDFRKATALEEYQNTDDKVNDTCITLPGAAMTVNEHVGHYAFIGPSWRPADVYVIEDNGAEWIRVTGDATGHSGEAVWVSSEPDATACSATDATKCFNTLPTCKLIADYLASAQKTYSFCEPRAGIPATEGIIPSLRSVSIAPTRITVGGGLGPRASVNVTFQDHPHHDRGIDPYVADRSYTPMDQGSFWAKFRARNAYYQGRVMRIKSGYVCDPFDLTNDFVTRTYLIERMSGPDSSGKVTISAKDPLKLADDKRAKAPVASPGVLAANITAGDGSATLSPTGIGNSSYPASGTARIGTECMTYTRAADVLTLSARGSDGTAAATHDADETVQDCLRYTGAEIDDVVYDLLVNYAGVSATWIDTAAWQSEVDDWLSGHLLDVLITEPTGVSTLLKEVTSLYMFDLWWDERTPTIKLKVLAPYSPPLTQITDDGNLVAGSVQVTDDPSRRLSQVWVYYGIINPTEPLTKGNNYRTVYIQADLDAETADQYDESRVATFYSRWFATNAEALRLASRTLLRYRDNPRTFAFRLDAKDSDHWTGDSIELVTRMVQDGEGASDPTPIKIVETREVRGGHAYAYKAVEDRWDGRYGRIGPNTLGAYSAEDEADKFAYGFVSADAAPFFPDGEDAYRTV